MDSTQTQSVKVEIYNQTYNIRGDGNSDYIVQLAELVDRRMREIASATLTVDSLKVAILAALQIADELQQMRRRYEQLDVQLAQRSAEAGELLDQVLKSYRSLERRLDGPLDASPMNGF
jgi:cell division protein ZapA